jgi:hypothetical protein
MGKVKDALMEIADQVLREAVKRGMEIDPVTDFSAAFSAAQGTIDRGSKFDQPWVYTLIYAQWPVNPKRVR